MSVKPSQFIIKAKNDENADRLHLYHTLFDHHLVVDEYPGETVDGLFRKLKEGQPLTETEIECVEGLRQMGMIVGADVDEEEMVARWYEKVIQGDSESMIVDVITTMACNMRCPYCFESGRLDDSKFLSNETVESSISWLKAQIVRRNIKRMNLIFFGGEPLLNMPAVHQVSDSICEFCAWAGVAFKGGVITNGTLLTPAVVKILSSSGISWVKVTFDGDREHHNRMRPFSNGEGTFDVIWENLEAAAKYLKIVIGCNFSNYNVESCKSLIEALAKASWRSAITDVRLKPVLPSNAKNSAASNWSCDHNSFTPGQLEQMLAFRREIKRYGLPQIMDPNIGPCDFYRKNAVTIGVAGELYPCAVFSGVSDYVIGRVTSDQPTEFGRQLEKLKSWNGECGKCPYLPLCVGGCRLQAYFQGKGVTEPVCDRCFYERMVPFLVANNEEENGKGESGFSIFA